MGLSLQMTGDWNRAGLHLQNLAVKLCPAFKAQIDEDGQKTVTFYDDIGESCEVELYSIRELLSMITSIRVVKCEKKIISDTNEPGSLERDL